MMRFLQTVWVVASITLFAFGVYWITAHDHWQVVLICLGLAVPVLAFQWFEDAVLKWPDAYWMRWASRGATLVLVVIFSAGFAGIFFDWLYS